MCPEKDAFGGIVGDLLPCQSPVPKGAVGHRREPVSGLDLASLLIQVENGGQGYPPVRFQLYQHGPAVVPLLGPIGRLGAKKDSLPIQFSGWLEKYLDISGCPGQPQGAARTDQAEGQSTIPQPTTKNQQGKEQESRSHSTGRKPILWQEPGGRKNSPGKGKGQNRQFPHGPALPFV